MRVRSRELFVGFLLALGVVAGACQSVQPATEVPATPSSDIVESAVITDSAVLTESLPTTVFVSDTVVTSSVVTNTVITDTVVTNTVITNTVVTETVAVESAVVTTTSALTPTSEITGGAEVSSTTELSRTSDVATPSTAVSDPALVAEGLAIYRAQYCGVCHTLSAAETRGTFGPTHDGMGETAVARLTEPTYAGKATTPAEYVHESIVDPQAFNVPGYATTSHRMPAYGHLDAATLDALVAFLLAQ